MECGGGVGWCIETIFNVYVNAVISLVKLLR